MSVTVKSLKKENDSLKNQIEVLTKDFKNLEEGLTKKFHQQQKSTTGNGREPPGMLRQRSILIFIASPMTILVVSRQTQFLNYNNNKSLA